MPTKDEIEEIKAWCQARKKEEKRLVLVERNPFRYKIKWTYRYPLIEIDRSLESAAKTSMVFESLSGIIWIFMEDAWRKVEPDFAIK